MPIVANTYRYVVGVDTHAATHTYAVIDCATGAVLDEATFPTTPAGLGRGLRRLSRPGPNFPPTQPELPPDPA